MDENHNDNEEQQAQPDNEIKEETAVISNNEQEEEQTEQQDGRPRRETNEPDRLTYELVHMEVGFCVTFLRRKVSVQTVKNRTHFIQTTIKQ